MKKQLTSALSVIAAALVPFLVSAQTALTPADLKTQGTLGGLVWNVIGYINLALFLLMAVATLMFVWYVIQYFVRPNENRKDAGNYVLYSVIGFFVIFSIWGIVNVVTNTFQLGGSSSSQPQNWQSFANIFPQ